MLDVAGQRDGEVAVISVCMLGGGGSSGAGVAEYYLMPERACGLGYYTGHPGLEAVQGRWVGSGAEALGLSGPLGPEGAGRLGQLLNAEDPDGRTLARPVWRPDPAGRVPSGPLLSALGHVAHERRVPLAQLFADSSDQATVLGIVRRNAVPAPSLATFATVPEPNGGVLVAAPGGALATRLERPAAGVGVDAALAGRLATVVGLDPVEVFRGADGTDRYTRALARAGCRVDVRRVGIDVTVSAPKSVSVLQGLADPETAALIEACHDRAVTQALGYLQRQAGHGFRGHHGEGQGMERVGTDGWIAAGFTHYASRAGDPQLHTHLVVPNLLRGHDGKWSAIDSRAVFRQAKTAGYLYQAALRHELTRELGVAWATPVKGQADIVGVPRQVLREFSERRRQIEDALTRTGGRGRAAAQAACLATRQRKQHTSLEVLRAGWQARTLRLGTSTATLLKAAGIRTARRNWRRRTGNPPAEQALELSASGLAAVAALVLGHEGVTAQATGFDRRDLLQALAVTLPAEHTGSALALERLADRLLTYHPAAVPLAAGEGAQDERWTTLELLAAEHRALTLAATTMTRATTPEPERLDALFASRPWLSPEQRAAVRHLCADDRLAMVLVGPAGSGKTAVLTAIKQLAQRQERPVVGCALAALTATRLEQGSGIASTSLAKLLSRLDAAPEQGLAPGTLVVLDEAGMVGTRQLAGLLEHTARAGGQVLLVGDPAQLPEIDAGGMFRHLSHPDQRPAVLVGNQRQQHPWEVAALGRLRAGQHASALASYVQHGCVSTSSSREALHTQVAADYLATTADAPPHQLGQTVVLASQHRDVEALNEQIRRALQAHRRLRPDELTLELASGPVGYCAGDQVIITRPCRDREGRPVLNGTRGQLIAAGSSGLQVQPDGGTPFTLSPQTATEAVRHGYALTIHKAQGVTATTALVVSDGLTGNAAYTALSRGRERNQLYLHIDDPQTGQPDWPGAFGRLCDQLGRPTGDTLASSQLQRPARPVATRREYEPPRQPTRGRSRGR
jgi:conjugative relaxase-like TrwC/TraI family protein